jgi:hypothetical protein
MAFVIALAAPASAQASFHLMKIREVYPGAIGNTGSEYVVLQMYAPGQNFVGGHELSEYGSCGFGCLQGSASFGSDVANGENQRTILLATPAAATQFGITSDTNLAEALDPSGGAVCWATDQTTPVDCVAWGSFSDSDPTKMARVGTPATAIPDGKALNRKITPNCSTLLENADDTNDSAADFQFTNPAPRNNASPITEAPCPDTIFDSGPTGPTNDSTPTFAFHSTLTGSTFQCKVDGGAFASCSSPFTTSLLTDGAHTVQARAMKSGGTDPTPASRSFTVDTTPPDTTINKVKVVDRKAKVKFTGSDNLDNALTFKCSLDGGNFKDCTSPKVYKHLSKGKHKVKVEAFDDAGNVDPTPAGQKFKV